jgi:hypothetical protein
MELMTGRGILAVIPVPPKARTNATPAAIELVRQIAALHLGKAALLTTQGEHAEALENTRAAYNMQTMAMEAELGL